MQTAGGSVRRFPAACPGELDVLDGHPGGGDRPVDGDQPGSCVPGARSRREDEPGNARFRHRTIMARQFAPRTRRMSQAKASTSAR